MVTISALFFNTFSVTLTLVIELELSTLLSHATFSLIPGLSPSSMSSRQCSTRKLCASPSRKSTWVNALRKQTHYKIKHKELSSL